MKELIDKFLNNGLADFEGLEIAGSIPIKQEVINEAITSFLQEAASERPKNIVNCMRRLVSRWSKSCLRPHLTVSSLDRRLQSLPDKR